MNQDKAISESKELLPIKDWQVTMQREIIA